MMFRWFVLLIWIKAILSVPNVQNVSVAARSETELTLRWSNDNSNYSYTLIDSNGVRQINSDQGAVRTYAVSSLSPGTGYTFTLHTVFEGAQSTGYTFTAITTPLNVGQVSTWQSDKHIDLSWSKVSYDSKYDYVLKVGKSEMFIPGYGRYMRHRVSSLSPVTEYNFTLFTVFKDVRSRGYTFTAATDPSNVESVSVVDRTENEATLEWEKMHNISIYVLQQNNDDTEFFIGVSDNVSVVRHTVSSLSPGESYRFTLYTVFNRRLSSGYHLHVVTVPLDVDSVTVQHQNETNIVLQFFPRFRHDYILKYGEIEAYIDHDYYYYYYYYYYRKYTVKSLSPGTKYNFTLYCVFDGVRSRGYNFSAETTPSKVTGLHCEHSYLGAVLTVVWDAPLGLWSEFEVQMNGKIPERVTVTRYQIYDVLSVLYDITVTSLSGHMRSTPVSLKCQSNTSGAIVGFVFAVLFIIVLLVCLGVFCKHRRFGLRRHSSGEQRNELTTVNNQPIDMIYVNTFTDNTQEKQHSGVESECKDVTEENNHYEAPDII